MLTNFIKDTTTKTVLHDWLKKSLENYASGSLSHFADEDSLVGYFFGCLAGSIATASGDFAISHHKTIGRGPGAEEYKLGADGLLIVKINTPDVVLEGYLLFQAKKALALTSKLDINAKHQCEKMLTHSAASYLLTLLPAMGYMIGSMAVASTKSGRVKLNDVPYVSFPRFITKHMLHGIMLEPLSNLGRLRSDELSSSIKRVVTAIGSSKDMKKSNIETIENALREAGIAIN